MDFPEWQNSKQHNEHFKAEERMENKGKTRKKTIFKDMVTDVPETDPRKNIFYMDKVDEKVRGGVEILKRKRSVLVFLMNTINNSGYCRFHFLAFQGCCERSYEPRHVVNSSEGKCGEGNEVSVRSRGGGWKTTKYTRA
mgnify:CR=1 FL=1|tara:strand:+ start:224 stop:640 length:417 start_codon:yes stop_codon:yes gene_type:complete